MIDERRGGTISNIDDVIPLAQRDAFMSGYKKAAGFAIEQLNTAPRTLAEGARVKGPMWAEGPCVDPSWRALCPLKDLSQGR
jgi:hypothetical protein